MSIEEEFEDLFRHIEINLSAPYHHDPTMSDARTLKVLESLLRVYKAEQRKRSAPTIKLEGVLLETFEAVRTILDAAGAQDPRVSLDIKIACLKRLQKSVKMWNKEGGRRGYYNFIEQFLL